MTHELARCGCRQYLSLANRERLATKLRHRSQASSPQRAGVTLWKSGRVQNHNENKKLPWSSGNGATSPHRSTHQESDRFEHRFYYGAPRLARAFPVGIIVSLHPALPSSAYALVLLLADRHLHKCVACDVEGISMSWSCTCAMFQLKPAKSYLLSRQS